MTNSTFWSLILTAPSSLPRSSAFGELVGLPGYRWLESSRCMSAVNQSASSVLPATSLSAPHRPIPLAFSLMHPSTFARYCADPSLISGLFAPPRRCDGASAATAPDVIIDGQWCPDWNDTTHLGVMQCAAVVSHVYHYPVAWLLFMDDRVVSGHSVTGDEPNNPVPPAHLPFLAVPPANNHAWAPGHFMNEVLPNLLWLDLHAPPHVPIAWPDGPVPLEIRRVLLQAGILHPHRPYLLFRPKRPSVLLVDQLYTLHTDRGIGYLYNSVHHIRLVQAAWQLIFAAKSPALHVHGDSSGAAGLLVRRRRTVKFQPPLAEQSVEHCKIAVVRRHGKVNRMLANHDQLIAELKAQFGSSSVVEFVAGGPGLNLTQIGALLQSVCIFIGPHGANMNNLFLLPLDSTVIEIGFKDPGFLVPPDFACAARNLGHRYYFSLALSGAYYADLVADIPEIVDICAVEGRRRLLMLNTSTAVPAWAGP